MRQWSSAEKAVERMLVMLAIAIAVNGAAHLSAPVNANALTDASDDAASAYAVVEDLDASPLISQEPQGDSLPSRMNWWAVSGQCAGIGTNPFSDLGPGPSARRGVIVDLAVQWQPEGELAPTEVDEQRARIAQAQEELLRDLGTHGELRRRYETTPQLAVTVDEQGYAILQAHRLVERVHDDRADAPTGKLGGAEQVGAGSFAGRLSS